MQKISKTSLISIVIIVFATMLAYSNSLHVPFVFDDFNTISYAQDVQNKDIGSIWVKNTTRFIPLASFALQSGMDVSSYHLVNITLHIATAILIYAFAYLLFQYTTAKEKTYELQALFVSLVFALHPLQTQAVTYIVQRSTIFATFFYVGSLLLYTYGRIHKKHWYIVSAFICTVLAMFTKEIAVTLPLAIEALEYTVFRTMWTKQNRKKDVLRLICFALTIAIIPLTLWTTRGYLSTLPAVIAKKEIAVASQITPQEKQLVLSQKEYFLTELTVVRMYIQLLVWPNNLNVDHDIQTQHSIFNINTSLSALFLLSLIWIAWKLRCKLGIASFGILFFFITLLLESSIFPIEDVMFEHRIYLPSIGFFLASIALIFTIPAIRVHHQKIIIGLIVLASIYLYGTYERNIVWQDPIHLWSDTVAKSPHKIRPLYILAWSYMERGDEEQAKTLADNIIRRDPTHALAHNLLGLIAYKHGDFLSAETYFTEAISLAPKIMSVRGNLASVLGQDGKIDESIQVSLDALAIDPHYIDARINLAASYTRQRKYDLAVDQYLAVIKENPNIALPYQTLAAIYAQQGKIEESDAMYNALQQLTN